ncbi:hypothetical protein B5E84_10240 [Lachnoclostridium sp. An14]|nr:hypothetical protein B5E84_10240 [Lachnoclostridium sp. An14]
MSIISNVDIFPHSRGSFGYFYLFLFVPPVKILSAAAGGAGKNGGFEGFFTGKRRDEGWNEWGRKERKWGT